MNVGLEKYWKMDCKGICKEDGFTFTWIIENFSYCYLKNGEYHMSPGFAKKIKSNIRWYLRLYPNGFNSNSKDFISFYLFRAMNDMNVNIIMSYIDFELSFIGIDGSVLVSKRLHVNNFEVGDTRSGSDEFVEHEEVFNTRRKDYLPGDVLTARCRILDLNREISRDGHWFARSRIRVQRRTFYWNIEKFSSFQESICEIASTSADQVVLKLKFFSSRGQNSETFIRVEVCANDQGIKFSTFRIYLVDSSGDCTKCLNDEYTFTENIRTALFKLTSKEELMKNKNRYVPNDVLQLYCECDIPLYLSELGVIEKICYGCPTIQEYCVTNDGLGSKKMYLDSTRILKENLEYLHKENLLCDTKLKTKSGSFPAHKCILSTRSPVFKKMFTNDMRERNSKCVDIEDLDDDTIQRMLQYIYTATMPDLQWDSACNLYAAADKYEILSLMNQCSSFLRDNLTEDSACDLLILADRHQDQDLKSVVQDYILNHRGIFTTNEWELFMKTNLQLAAELLFLTVKEIDVTIKPSKNGDFP